MKIQEKRIRQTCEEERAALEYFKLNMKSSTKRLLETMSFAE